MIFDNFTMEGFGSTKSIEINLNQKGITIIKGPTGVGKTNILSGLVWTLYGKNLRGKAEVNLWKRYRTSEYLGTMNTLYFRNNGATYKIIRCQNYKGKVEGASGNNRVLFYKDAVLIEPKKKLEIQSEITQALGMSYNLFMNSIMFGQGLKRLIQEDSSDQKSIFEEIFNLHYISKGKELAKSKYTLANNKYITVENLYKQTNNALEVINNTLEKAELEASEFKKIQKEKLKELKQLKNTATMRIKELGAKEAQIENFSKIKLLNENLKEALEKAHGLKNKKSSLNIEQLLEQVLEFLEAKNYKDCKKNVKQILKDLKAIEITNQYISDLKDEISELKEKEFKHKLRQERLLALESNLKSYKKRIQELKDTKPPQISSDLKEKRDKYLKELTGLNQDLARYKEDVEVLKWVYTEPLGNNGLKAFLFDSSMGELNKILDSYTDTLGISIQFLINTNNARKDFEAVIKMDGMIVFYEELSGGQKQLIHLAMAFAMNELKGINIAFLDEVFENLSYDCIEIVVGLLKKIYKDKTLFLITHQDSLPIGNVRTIHVTRTKGISEYKF